MTFASGRRRLLLALATAFATSSLVAPALAEFSSAAAALCSGGKDLKRVNGAIVNKNKDKGRMVSCTLPETQEPPTMAGAVVNVAATRSTRKLTQPLICTLESFDGRNRLVASGTSLGTTLPGTTVQQATVLSSDCCVVSGYYLVSCMLPPKSTIHSLTLGEF